MPKFKAKTHITMGVKNDKGEVEMKTFEPGQTVELTKEQAAGMSHAVEKGPTGLEELPKDVAEAVQSVIDKPEHRDSGIQLDWKVDDFARQNSGATRRASEIGIKANEAIGAGYERSNEPDETSGEELPTPGAVRASQIAPGEEVKAGEKQAAPEGSAAQKAGVKK